MEMWLLKKILFANVFFGELKVNFKSGLTGLIVFLIFNVCMFCRVLSLNTLLRKIK